MTVPSSSPENKPGSDRDSSANSQKHSAQKVPEGLNDYVKAHTRETIAYILMILGIILLFFDPISGGVLVGLIAGSYFGEEIVDYLKAWKIGADYEAITRNFIIGGLAIAFLVSSPAIFVGLAVAVGIKQLFIGTTSGGK